MALKTFALAFALSACALLSPSGVAAAHEHRCAPPDIYGGYSLQMGAGAYDPAYYGCAAVDPREWRYGDDRDFAHFMHD